MPRYDPWVGPLYWSEGFCKRRVLLVGESHYAGGGIKIDSGPQPTSRDFTQQVVATWALGKSARYFTMVARLMGKAGGTSQSREYVWNRVAFYNYVQDIVGTRARIRPTEEMWRRGAAPFRRVLDELKPEVVIALGKELWHRLPQIDQNRAGGHMHTPTDGTSVTFGMTNHPSWPGFSPDAWAPRVAELLERKGAGAKV